MVNEEEIKEELIKLFKRIFMHPEIKFEAVEFCKSIFSEPDTEEELV